MDKAIRKGSVVIQRHSMKIKGKEYCKWIDDNYLMIGKAYFYKGEFDLHVEFVRGYPIHIPVPNNRHYLSRKIEMIDHCLLELKKNEYKVNLPNGQIYKEAFPQILSFLKY